MATTKQDGQKSALDFAIDAQIDKATEILERIALKRATLKKQSIPTLKDLSSLHKLRTDRDPFRHNNNVENTSTVTFRYSSELVRGYAADMPAWDACMVFYVADLPRLMREYFFWDQDNVAPEYSNYIRSCSWSANCRQQTQKGNARQYLLTDRSTECLWTACLVVTAAENRLDVLSNFRLWDLTIDTLDFCTARNEKNSLVYSHKPSHPEDSINATYDDMPMKGVWP